MEKTKEELAFIRAALLFDGAVIVALIGWLFQHPEPRPLLASIVVLLVIGMVALALWLLAKVFQKLKNLGQ